MKITEHNYGTIFSQSNGYMGVRASFEENGSLGVQGAFIRGKYTPSYKGARLLTNPPFSSQSRILCKLFTKPSKWCIIKISIWRFYLCQGTN